MNLKQIRARLAEIKAEATKILDTADADNGGALTDENQAKFDALIAERDSLDAHAKRLEQVEAMDARVGRVTAPAAPATTPERPTQVSNPTPAIESDPMRGFRSAAEFGRAVQAAGKRGVQIDERLFAIEREDRGVEAAPSSYMKETGSSDGYMVPPQIASEVTSLVFDDEGLLARFAPEPTVGNVVGEPVDESTPWGTAGIQAYWESEAGQMTASKPSTKMNHTVLHKLYAFVNASDELLEDAPRLQNRLTVKASEAIRWKAEEALINGNGVGQPLGVHEAAALVSVSKKSGQSADTIVAENVLNMRARLFGSDSGAFWLAHSSTIPQLGVMTIGDQPVWADAGKEVKSGLGKLLLGLPLVISEHAQVLGDAGDIQLIQPKGYMSYVKAGGVKFALSMHLYFDYGLGSFRWTFRIGGQPKLSAAISQAKGSGTLSHFIDVAARA